MELLNEQKTDFSNEVIIQLAICLEAVYAAEIICYKVADTLDRSGYINSLFQKRKQDYRKARTMIQDVISKLEVAFDQTFDNIVYKKDGSERMRAHHVQGTANDLVQLLLIYFARGDGDPEKKDRMKKALLNFKPTLDIDLDAIMKYYNFKL